MRVCLLLLSFGLLVAQKGADEVYRVGPGVTPPKIIWKVEPHYTREGLDARIQGACVFEIVVDENGKATDINLLSPLGFGLDERGKEAILQWRFVPGMKDGNPVKIGATVEVYFRLMGRKFDSKAEKQRTDFNLAAYNVTKTDEQARAKAVETVQRLASDKYPGAMFLAGMWMDEGKVLPSNPPESLRLISAAADKNYGPAMFEIGRRYVDGRGFAADPDKGLKLMRDAAVLGSSKAQLYLGLRYEKGEGVEQDRERAKRYFRLCAAPGEPACQFKLAEMLLNGEERTEREYVQAIAWLELAAARRFQPAVALLEKERPNVTTAQALWAEKLKPVLTRRP